MKPVQRTGRLLAVLAVCGVGLPSYLRAEDKEYTLDAITVKGEAVTTESQPITINVVGKKKIDELKLREPEKILEEVPGIEIHRYGMGGVANEFAIRGFNNAGHGGDAAIAIDGIILNEGESHADGYADMNVIIPLELDRVEVFKGPSSPLFGNFARGGAISFLTRKTGDYKTIEATGGSFGTFDFQTVMGQAVSKNVQVNTALQFSTTDGYQDNSSWQRGNFSGRVAWQVTPELDLALSTRVHKSTWDAPGYIPASQFNDKNNWFHQAANAENDGGHKLFTTEKIELGYNLSDNSRILGWFYSTQQDFTRFAKFGYDPGGQTERYYNRTVFGTGTSYNYAGTVANRELTGVAGFEFLNEDTDWKRWNTSNRVRSAMIEDRAYNIKTISLFGEVDYALHPLFKPWVGFRYDTFAGDVDNRDPGTMPSKNGMNDYSHFSPKVGFHSQLHKTLDFRASYCEGFALPKDVEKFNSAVGNKETTVRQYEVGLKYKPSNLLDADLAVFRIDTDGEVQEYPSGSGNFLNLGSTQRDGLELAVTVRPWLPGLELFGDYTLMKTKITENADATMVGKKVTGVPNYTTNLGLRYKHSSGVNGRLKWRHAGQYYIDGANTATYSGYDVVDLSLGYEFKTANGSKWRISGDIDNLLDKHYSQAVWNGYGTNNYAVSPPRTFLARVGIDF